MSPDGLRLQEVAFVTCVNDERFHELCVVGGFLLDFVCVATAQWDTSVEHVGSTGCTESIDHAAVWFCAGVEGRWHIYQSLVACCLLCLCCVLILCSVCGVPTSFLS